MLTIRKERIHVISRRSDEEFIDRMTTCVRGDFPHQFEELGPARVRAFTQEVMALGLRHEVEAGGAMAVLLQLTLMFGMNFERSPDAAWAKELLATCFRSGYVALGSPDQPPPPVPAAPKAGNIF